MSASDVARELSDVNVSGRAQDPEGLQQPDDYHDPDDDVEYLLNLAVHGDVVVDQPKQHSDDDQKYDDVQQIHLFFASPISAVRISPSSQRDSYPDQGFPY